MKAATYILYGTPDVISLTDQRRPEPREGEVLIRVHASTVSAGDWRMRSLSVPPGLGPVIRAFAGWTRPRQPILGSDAAGIIVAKGVDVQDWDIGDAVIAYPGARMGAHAEYLVMPAGGAMVRMPRGLGFAEAAAIPFGGLTALEFLKDKAGLKPGEKVLVVGASGAVGSAAVQLAVHFGAEVTGVCSAANAALVRDLGAKDVIDYRMQDIAALSTRHDMIVDTTGSAPWKRVGHLLTPRGRLVAVSSSLPDMLRAPFNRRLVGGVATGSREGLEVLARLAEQGAFRPVIDQVFDFAQVRQAHARVDTRRKAGSVVLTMVPEEMRALAKAG